EKALKGKAVYIVGADPAGDDTNLAKALKAAKFVEVQEIRESATNEIANVVFPAQAFTERDGTFVSGERRAQRFYAALPPKGESKPDYAITALLAKQMGVILQGLAASVVFEILANSIEAFNELSYETLAQVKEQWPIVGRSDLYYGGATYENTKGMGVQLIPLAQAGGTVKIPRVRKEAALRPKEKELLAIPINKLYDLGVTVRTAEFLAERIGEPFIAVNPETAQKFGVQAGQTARISFEGGGGEAVLKLDETIPSGVALIPRSMGIAIHEPAVAKVKS
ncbi:hypothetical protein FBQ83_15240, partial [Chloroflexi bacterium CFX5]|nr:hypothetical protein [Chloroflexi bacterium CFX5]